MMLILIYVILDDVFLLEKELLGSSKDIDETTTELEHTQAAENLEVQESGWF